MRGRNLYKLLFVAVFAVALLGFSPSALAYGDSDNIPSSVENASPNNGDNNYDGTRDKRQDDVATTTNPNDTEAPNSWVSLEVSSPNEGSDWQIDEFNPVDPATLPSQPDGTIFPVGMFEVKLSNPHCGCHNYEQEVERSDYISEFSETPAGDTVHLKLIFDRVLDTSKWTTQKYDPVTNTYYDYSSYVTISTQLYGDTYRTVLEWDVVDGGLGDSDGVVNCEISDPIGPTIPVATPVTATTTSVTTTVKEPTLAETGLGTNIVLTIGVILIALSIAIFPKRSQQ